MADPLSVLGVGLGAVSLLLQVIDECGKRYKQIVEASEMLATFKYLRVRMQMEQQRFLNFASEAIPLFEDGQICATLSIKEDLFIAVLSEINVTFQKFEEYGAQYDNTLPQATAYREYGNKPRVGLRELLSLPTLRPRLAGESVVSINGRIQRVRHCVTKATRRLSIIISQPRRLIWVSVGKEALEALVSKLSDLNSFLISLLNESHTRRLVRALDIGYLQFLHHQDNPEDLNVFVEALGLRTRKMASCDERGTSIFPVGERKEHDAQRDYLQELAKIKLRRIEVEELYKDSTRKVNAISQSMILELSTLNFPHALKDEGHYGRRTFADWNARKVWVEWIDHDVTECTSSDEARRETKASLLAQLLHKNIPAGFRTLQCLGYIKSSQVNCGAKFGIVFAPPTSVNSKSSFATLRQLLLRSQKPPLSTRLSLSCILAQCLFSFHSVDWLHKGLHSNNVLFFGNEGEGTHDTTGFDLTMPYVTGFDLSRPGDRTDLTDKPNSDPLSDIYRHPHAQFGEARTSYRRSYDIYTFGVLLIEIALWKPIEAVIGIKDIMAMRQNELYGIHKRLLGSPTIDHDISMEAGLAKSENEIADIKGGCPARTAHECGDAYGEIVKLCLQARDVERPTYKGEPNTAINFRIQTMFEEQVKDKLHYMKMALVS
ncbi:hypothetical protein F5Y19DRAFT_444981 [Xylariaceae sp. FL1651]|nr:hypothetical protein F5Y19DRAFT_444981 [Xylariaceae sp. FL1651]